MAKYTKAIIKTLAYSSIFKYPLSFNQLCTYLISNREKKIIYKELKDDLQQLCNNRIVENNNKKYSLNSFKTNNWQERYNNSTNLLNQNQQALELLKKIPWIKLLAITGSVAAYNAEKEDDIDIFIITEKNRMWLTRIFVWAFLALLKKYAHFNDNKNKFCPNIFMDESFIKWPTNRQNIYIAHEIALMQPIINRDNTYFKFIKENGWIFEYLPYFRVNTTNFKKTKQKENFIVDYLDKTAEKLQRKHMKKKITTEIVHKNFIHFNKKDSTQNIIETYMERTKKIS